MQMLSIHAENQSLRPEKIGIDGQGEGERKKSTTPSRGSTKGHSSQVLEENEEEERRVELHFTKFLTILKILRIYVCS